MSIEAAIQKWANSPAGKKRIAEERAKKLKSGQQFGQGSGGVSVAQAQVYAEKLRKCIYDNLPASLKAGSTRPIELNDIIISEPTVLPNGYISINLSFAPDAIHRESLDPKIHGGKYAKGVDNIVSLLTKGYTAHGDVSGMWHGQMILNKLERAPEPFIQEGVDAFLAKHGGVAQVTLPDEYKVQ